MVLRCTFAPSLSAGNLDESQQRFLQNCISGYAEKHRLQLDRDTKVRYFKCRLSGRSRRGLLCEIILTRFRNVVGEYTSCQANPQSQGRGRVLPGRVYLQGLVRQALEPPFPAQNPVRVAPQNPPSVMRSQKRPPSLPLLHFLLRPLSASVDLSPDVQPLCWASVLC